MASWLRSTRRAALLAGIVAAAVLALTAVVLRRPRRPTHRIGWYAYHAIFSLTDRRSIANMAQPSVISDRRPPKQLTIRHYAPFKGGFPISLNGTRLCVPGGMGSILASYIIPGIFSEKRRAARVVYRLSGQPWPSGNSAGDAPYIPIWKAEPNGVNYEAIRQRILARSISISLGGRGVFCVPLGVAALRINPGGEATGISALYPRGRLTPKSGVYLGFRRPLPRGGKYIFSAMTRGCPSIITDHLARCFAAGGVPRAEFKAIWENLLEERLPHLTELQMARAALAVSAAGLRSTRNVRAATWQAMLLLGARFPLGHGSVCWVHLPGKHLMMLVASGSSIFVYIFGRSQKGIEMCGEVYGDAHTPLPALMELMKSKLIGVFAANLKSLDAPLHKAHTGTGRPVPRHHGVF